MGIPHLVQYQGSKRKLAKDILCYLPDKIEGNFIEPFSGTAAITIAVASEKIADKFIINDLNKPLSDLLKEVIGDPEFVSEKYINIWEAQFQQEDHYFSVRDQFNDTQDPVLFLYLLARCVKGAVRYNSNGKFNQSNDKRRNGTKPPTMEKNIRSISKLLKNKVEVYSKDYKEILDMARPGDFVYMDPPYQGVCGNRDSRYFSSIDHKEFVNELEKLNRRGVNYIVSYDGSLGDKGYGEILPEYLNLKHIFLEAGKSAQATLLGKNEKTVESLYISQNL